MLDDFGIFVCLCIAPGVGAAAVAGCIATSQNTGMVGPSIC